MTPAETHLFATMAAGCAASVAVWFLASIRAWKAEAERDAVEQHLADRLKELVWSAREYDALKASHDAIDKECDRIAQDLAAFVERSNGALESFRAALAASESSANYWKHQHDLRVTERDAAQEALAPFRNRPRGEHGHFVGRGA